MLALVARYRTCHRVPVSQRFLSARIAPNKHHNFVLNRMSSVEKPFETLLNDLNECDSITSNTRSMKLYYVAY